MRISDWSSDVCSSDLADHRITAASWNRAVASFDRLYRWGEQQGLIADAPFNRRAVWRPAQGGRRGMIAARNDAYERVARRSDVRFVHRRSEEHTSELQSLMRISYAVFCLKKKNNNE